MTITNDQRTAWAAAALHGYATHKEGGTDLYDEAELVLSDLLTDLIHYAENEDIDFQRCVARAWTHFHEERAEERTALATPALSEPAETGRS